MRTIATGCTIAVLVAMSAKVARGDCDELKAIALPLTGDTMVTLSGGDVHCDSLASGEPPEFSIEGGGLTLTGPNTATFVNVKFNIAEGASLTFDFDTTEFGPDTDQGDAQNGEGYMLLVDEGALASFNGEMVVNGVQNYRSVFYNAGTLEFLGDARFSDCTSSIFRDNTGSLRFRGDATFERIAHLGINNDGGSVSFDRDLSFDTIGTQFDGADGAALANNNNGMIIISGTSVFQNTRSDGNGGALYNEGLIFSSDVAQFFGNSAGGDGGAVYNGGGFITFGGEVYMHENVASSTGGGIAAGGGGSVSFNAHTLIQHNVATSTGGGMSILDGSNGSKVRFLSSASVFGNIKTETALGCNNIYLEPNSVLIGYESDGDICDES